MTKYEKALEEGLPPMNTLEWLMLEVCCEDLIGDQLSEGKQFFKDFWMEIEHLYKDEPEKLNLIYEKIYLVDSK